MTTNAVPKNNNQTLYEGKKMIEYIYQTLENAFYLCKKNRHYG